MPVYLDHAATTPMRPEAVAALTAALATVGNPASIHSAGQRAKRSLEESRAVVAATLDADPIELVFTGNGTEAINLAIKGLYWQRQHDAARPRIVLPAGEHHATPAAARGGAHFGRAPGYGTGAALRALDLGQGDGSVC